MAQSIDYKRTHSHEWFEIQVSRAEADDWFSTNETADTLTSILDKLAKQDPRGENNFDYRVVRKVLTEDVVVLKDMPSAVPVQV